MFGSILGSVTSYTHMFNHVDIFINYYNTLGYYSLSMNICPTQSLALTLLNLSPWVVCYKNNTNDMMIHHLILLDMRDTILLLTIKESAYFG